MGTTLSVTTGFGFAVPPEVVDWYEKQHENDDDYYDFGERLYDLVHEEPLLDTRTAYFYDYSPTEDDKEASVVILKSSRETEYGVGVFRARSYQADMPVADEFNALHRVAEKLGIQSPEFEFLTVVSCG